MRRARHAPLTPLRELCGGTLPALVMFDLDGTLIDSVPDIARAVDRTLAAHGLPPAGEQRVRGWVGRGSRQLLRDALACMGAGAPDDDLVERALAFYLPDYLADCTRDTRLCRGAAELVHRLHASHVALACVTNKPIAITRRVLAHFALERFFHCVLGGDSGAGVKPAPGPLRHAMDACGTTAARSLMVGDSRHDVDAARAAGVAVACVEHGYNHGEDIRLARPDRVVASLLELL